MPSGETLRVAVVDNMEINQFGTQRLLAKIPNLVIEDRWLLDFDAAMTRTDWADVDVVVLDVAHDSSPEDETPSAPVARHIRQCVHDPQRPLIIAVTSNPIAWSEPLIHRRLLAADENIGLVWREDFEQQIKSVVDGLAIVHQQSRLDAREVPRRFEDLGIDANTDIEELFRGTRALMKSNTKNERKTFRDRVVVASRARLNPVTKEGNAPYASDVPSLRQFGRIWTKLNPSLAKENVSDKPKRDRAPSRCSLSQQMGAGGRESVTQRYLLAQGELGRIADRLQRAVFDGDGFAESESLVLRARVPYIKLMRGASVVYLLTYGGRGQPVRRRVMIAGIGAASLLAGREEITRLSQSPRRFALPRLIRDVSRDHGDCVCGSGLRFSVRERRR